MRTTRTLQVRLARRLLVALALALAITFGGAAAALAATGPSAGTQQRAAVQGAVQGQSPDQAARAGERRRGISPLVPLVFAGILLLAAAPAIPRPLYPGRYYRAERW